MRATALALAALAAAPCAWAGIVSSHVFSNHKGTRVSSARGRACASAEAPLNRGASRLLL